MTFDEGKKLLSDGQWIAYGVEISNHDGDLMDLETWIDGVRTKGFIDYDGMGHQVDKNGNLVTQDWIYPSKADQISPKTKYILWYNR